MALATYGPALTAIREVIDSAHGSLRTIPAERFSDELPEGLSAEEATRRGVLASKPFRVRLANQRRHPASPPMNASVNLIALDVIVTVSRTITPLEQADADAMAALEVLAAEDADALRQALETPPNLAATVASTATGIVGGCLRYVRSETPRVISQRPPAQAQRFETTHRFEAVLRVQQAIT